MNSVCTSGWTPLHYATVNSTNVEVLKFLIESGADVDGNASESVRPPLFFAIRKKNIPFVQILIDSGANVNYTSTDGFTPFHIALELNDKCFSDDLILNLMSPVADKASPITHHIYISLHFAVSQCRPKVVQSILERVISDGTYIETTDGTSSNTPLHSCAKSCMGEAGTYIATMLLMAGANAAAIDSNGMTPLDVAIAESNEAVVRTLRELGPNKRPRKH